MVGRGASARLLSCPPPPTRRLARMSGASVRQLLRCGQRIPGSTGCWSTPCSRSAAPPVPAARTIALTTINPFINYNFGGGWFVGTSTDHDRQLGYRRRKMDAAGGRAVRPADQDRRQAAGEPAGRSLLQRTAADRHRHLAVAHAGHLHLLSTHRARRGTHMLRIKRQQLATLLTAATLLAGTCWRGDRGGSHRGPGTGGRRSTRQFNGDALGGQQQRPEATGTGQERHGRQLPAR